MPGRSPGSPTVTARRSCGARSRAARPRPATGGRWWRPRRFVAFVDSDTVVTPGWLTRSMGHFADDRVGIVAVRVQAPSPEPGAGVLGAFESSRSPLDLGDEPGRVAPRTRIAYVPAAGLLVRTSALRDLDGFDDSLIVGEDVDLVWRADDRGWRVRYEPAARIVHDVRPTMRAWVRQRFDYGTSAAVLDERHPGSVAPVSASPWSLGAWAAVGLGHPVAGGMVALGSAAALPRRLPGVPASEALRLALAGHVGAGRLLARSVVRVWWPVALGASLVSRRGPWGHRRRRHRVGDRCRRGRQPPRRPSSRRSRRTVDRRRRRLWGRRLGRLRPSPLVPGDPSRGHALAGSVRAPIRTPTPPFCDAERTLERAFRIAERVNERLPERLVPVSMCEKTRTCSRVRPGPRQDRVCLLQGGCESWQTKNRPRC